MAKAALEIKSLARVHTKSALKVLAGIMNEPEAQASARVSAATALLDRGWGKAPQVIAGDQENPLRLVVEAAGVALDGKFARLVSARITDSEKPTDQ